MEWKSNGIRVPQLIKQTVMAETDYCCYCGEYFMFDLKPTADHVIPTCKGGVNSFINKKRCCVKCNNEKGSYYPHEWGRKLIEFRNMTLKSVYPIQLITARVSALDKKIINVKKVALYVEKQGLSLFIDKYHFEYFKDCKQSI